MRLAGIAQMYMNINKPRDTNQAIGLDHGGIRTGKPFSPRGNNTVSDQDILNLLVL